MNQGKRFRGLPDYQAFSLSLIHIYGAAARSGAGTLDVPVFALKLAFFQETVVIAVSYTHLDVYKRQLVQVGGGNSQELQAFQQGKVRSHGLVQHCLLYTSMTVTPFKAVRLLRSSFNSFR